MTMLTAAQNRNGNIKKIIVTILEPAGMNRKVLDVVGVLLILLKVQLCQELTSFNNSVVSILQHPYRTINLQKTNRQKK